jgi:hypothetical protein
MSEPRWHDADPRPRYGSVPGPEIRPARNTPQPAPGGGRLRGSDRPAAWEGPGWYRDDSDPVRSVEMTTGPGQADDPADDSRRDRARDRRPDRRRADPDAPPASSWRWGQLSGGRGTLIVVAAAVLGAIVTVATKHDPGSALGWLVVAGTLIAGFAVRPRSAYLLIPVPALAYVVFGVAAGFIRTRSDPSSSGLAVGAAQWIANGFLTMAAATVLAAVIALVRWLLSRRATASPTGRRRAGSGVRRDSGDRLDRADGARSGRGGQSGRGDRSDWPGRARPAFYPNPDWPGDRGAARDPRDRRPPPGPPSFGASRDLGHRVRDAG